MLAGTIRGQIGPQNLPRQTRATLAWMGGQAPESATIHFPLKAEMKVRPRNPRKPVFDFRAHFCHSAPMETHAFGFRLPAQRPEGQKRFPISRLLGVALMLAVVSGTAGNAVADPKRFVLTPLAFLGTDSRGEPFFDVFESNVINNRGDVLFGSSLPRRAAGPFSRPRSFCCVGESRLRSRGPATTRRGAAPSCLRGFFPHQPQRQGRCGLRLSARSVSH